MCEDGEGRTNIGGAMVCDKNLVPFIFFSTQLFLKPKNAQKEFSTFTRISFISFRTV